MKFIYSKTKLKINLNKIKMNIIYLILLIINLQLNFNEINCDKISEKLSEKEMNEKFESEFDSERKWNCTILSKRNNVYELLFKNKTEKYEKDKLIIEYHCDFIFFEKNNLTEKIYKRCFKNKLYNNLYAITYEKNGKMEIEIETKCSEALMNIIFERTFNSKREWKSTIILIRRQLYEVNFKYKNYKSGEYIGERNEYDCLYEVNDCKIISGNCTDKIKTKIKTKFEIIDSLHSMFNNTLNVNKQDIKDMTENTIPRILIKLKDEIKNLKPLFKGLLKALARLG